MGPGKPGFETMVLLCRDDPLPTDVNLTAILGTFGPQPFACQSPGAVAWFENGRTVHDEKQPAPLTKAVEGGNPLERLNAEIFRRRKRTSGTSGRSPTATRGQVMARISAMVVLLCAGASWAAGPPDREAWE